MLKLRRALTAVAISRLLTVLLRPVLVLVLSRTIRGSLPVMVRLRPLLLPCSIGLPLLIALLRPAFILPLRLVLLFLRRPGLIL